VLVVPEPKLVAWFTDGPTMYQQGGWF